MDSQIQDAVAGWESQSVPDGFEGLHHLADAEFSGAVSARRTWAFLLNGRVVGVVDGTVDAFEGTPLSAYEAPDPALPLLYAMQTGESRQRAKYYTEDTPLSEADSTLSEGGFTGYVELAENVHSGDYYVVYHGGKSMSAAFVGNRRDLLTGDEAFERADDEIGVYYVYEADVQVIDVPEPEPEPDAGASAGDTAVVDAGAGADASAGPSSPAATTGPEDPPETDAPSSRADPDEEAEASDRGTDTSVTADADASATEASTDPTVEPGDGDEPPSTTTADGTGSDATPATGAEPASGTERASRPDADPDAETPSSDDEGTDVPDDPGGDDTLTSRTEPGEPADEDEDEGAAPTETSDAAGPVASTETTESSAGRDAAATGGDRDAGPRSRPDASETPPGRDGDRDDVTIPSSPDAGTDAGEAADPDPFSAEERWREARGIPALDPEGTDAGEAPEHDEARSAGKRGDRSDRRESANRDRSERTRTETVQRQRDEDGTSVADLRARLDAATTARAEAEQAREAAEERAARLESELEESREARADLREEREDLRERGERLDDRVAELEAEVARLESELTSAGGDPDAQSVTPTEALAGTHLFVRYDTASGPTLAKAHGGEATGEEVAENLRLEHHHTDFDTGDVAVDGQPFDEFLESTTQYQFVHWLVYDLLYDIGETGNRESLTSLFDAIPEVDHVEFEGGVTVPAGEGADAESESVRFDVVVRDGMGNPLFVADLNTERSAASEAMMRSLVGGARRVANSKESLAAAFLVTASFFDPGALEAAADETANGGFFGGSSKKSYVKLSRKQGFHVCLVETRENAFHLNVPEL